MATIENYVNLPSAADYQEILKKFPAFASAPLSEKAEKNKAWKYSAFKTGWYFTRTASPVIPNILQCVSILGCLFDYGIDRTSAGLRITLQITYDPKNKIEKSCKEVYRAADISIGGDIVWEKNTAPVVTFGKKEYIWLNKDECENGKEKTMRLVSLELIARAKPFDKIGQTNDYGSDAAKELRQQCENEALEFATKEEKKLLVKVRLSDKDGYKKAEPILKTKQEKINPEKPRNR